MKLDPSPKCEGEWAFTPASEERSRACSCSVRAKSRQSTSFKRGFTATNEKRSSVHARSVRVQSGQNLSQTGFTLLEILIIIAIVGIITVITIVVFVNLRDAEALRRDASSISSFLETARVHTISSKGNTSYGVHIENNDIMIFSGTAYDPNNVTASESLHTTVRFDSISLADGSSTIVFERISGATDNYGTIVLESTQRVASSTITIEPTGSITTEF
ncbi:MAG: prepilin-type N-terminal cleavage/methylation domain-containing protein [Candidatus Paceibacterota bacterium]